MKKFILLCFFILLSVSNVKAGTQVGLGTADSFAVLAGSGITNSGATTITGDVGSFPTTTQSGFGSVTLNGTNNFGNSVTQGAKTDLTTAYNDAAGRTTTSTIPTELGGTTLTEGTFVSSAGTFGITGTVTLDGQGNSNSVFIFKMDTTLITATSSRVLLTNSAQACNVYWQVGSSATLGTSTSLIGNVLALTSITDDGGSTVNGRLLARNGAVTLNNTTISKSTCATGTAGGAAFAASNASLASGSPYCPDISSSIVIPTILESKRLSPTSIFVSWGPYSGVDTFNVQYGTKNNSWLYNTDVKGFSTTLSYLPSNSPIWVRVAPRSNCTIGSYGSSKLIGGPRLPSTGFAPWCRN